MIEHFKIISLEEFKASELWNSAQANKKYLDDNLILESINISSTIINYLSGNQIEIDINNGTLKEGETTLNTIKVACERETWYLLRNGVEYMRAASNSISSGSFNFSYANPQEQLYIPAEVYMLLNKTGYLIQSIQFDLFEKSPGGRDNCWNWEKGQYEGLLDELDKRYTTISNGIASRDNSVIVVKNEGMPPTNAQWDLGVNVDNLPKPDLTPYEKIVDHNADIKTQHDFTIEVGANLQNNIDNLTHYVEGKEDITHHDSDIEHINEVLETKEDLLTQTQLDNINMDHSKFGKVKTVNLKEPDENGNVDVSEADNVYTKTETDAKFETIENHTNDLIETNSQVAANKGAIADLTAKVSQKQDNLTPEQLSNINLDHSIFGKVKTVNEKGPDENGNVDIPGFDDVYTKEESDNRFLSKKTPFDVVSDLDETKTKIHADYQNVQLYNSAGNSEIFLGTDLRIVGDNNQVDMIHDPTTHNITYERDDFTNAPDRTVANLGYVKGAFPKKFSEYEKVLDQEEVFEWPIPSGTKEVQIYISGNLSPLINLESLSGRIIGIPVFGDSMVILLVNVSDTFLRFAPANPSDTFLRFGRSPRDAVSLIIYYR